MSDENKEEDHFASFLDKVSNALDKMIDIVEKENEKQKG